MKFTILHQDANYVAIHKPAGMLVHRSAMSRDRLVVLQGLKDYIVVQNENIILVCKLEEEQKIKQFVNEIRSELGEGML